MQVLGIDVGTSAIKAAVLNAATAQPVGIVVKVEYPIDRPQDDAAEVRSEELWKAIAAASRQAMVGHHVEGVGLSSLTPGLVLLDARDHVLGPIWIHLDRRSRPQARRALAEVGDEFLREVGCRPLPGGISALCWATRIERDSSLRPQVRRYLHPNGWLALRLTGQTAFDPAGASFSGLFGTTTTGMWSPRWCDFFGVEPSWLPPVIDGAATVGELLPGPAAELGLPAGIPLKMGTADTSSAILAADLQPGELLHTVGTTQVLATFAEKPIPDARRLTRRFGVGDSFVHVTHNPVGGVALDWLRDLCFSDVTEDDYYRDSIDKALQRTPRIRLDPPFLGGDRLQIEPAYAAFVDLSLGTDRFDLLAALLISMREQHYAAVEALGVGSAFSRVVLTGGGADLVRRLIPEYSTINVAPLDEGALRGVARLFQPPA